ncbi:hypothetical protein GCM10007362_34090 [Saccharibacillus endophyticus]|uniref:Uncharacterized protein n=1 Tax=Saccharibacillus endophyticus TaxID=2060666 RepID=A0ABQ2A225_9BACL|nr:hypothetical protein GCM10007362_34090 [Saccharibacillus endophyticus]
MITGFLIGVTLGLIGWWVMVRDIPGSLAASLFAGIIGGLAGTVFLGGFGWGGIWYILLCGAVGAAVLIVIVNRSMRHSFSKEHEKENRVESILFRVGLGIVGIVQLILVIWMVLGYTAAFQMIPDLIGTVVMVLEGIPMLLLSVLSLIMSFGRPRWSGRILRILVLSASIFLISIAWNSVKELSPEAWLTERVDSNMFKITEDDRYVYQIEIVNRYQRNEHARLFVERRIGAQEKYIELDLSSAEMSGMLYSEYDWGELTLKQGKYIYLLSPSPERGNADWQFEVNMADWTAKRIR